MGAQRDPMGGDPWEPKGSHGRGTLGSPRDPMGGEPLGAQGIPWEGTLGSPGTTEAQFEASWGLQEPFWRYSVFPNDFPRNPTIMKIDFPSVSHDSFRRNSSQSVRNRCPVMFQPLVYYIWTVFSCKKPKNFVCRTKINSRNMLPCDMPGHHMPRQHDGGGGARTWARGA